MTTTSLSQSKIKTFLRCPKKYEYRYIEDLNPKSKPLPMERGIWIHSCLESYYKGKNWKKTLKFLRGQFLKLFDEERELYGDLPGEVERIVQSYIKFYDDDDWEVLAVEEDFQVKLKSGLVLKGKMDLVVRDDLGVWIVEHKSNQRLPSEGPRIPDPQTTIYNYALKGMGLEGIGTIHNHIRTVPPSEPYLLKSGDRLSTARGVDTDYRTYLNAIKENGFDPSDYEEVLHRLKNEQRFFRRFIVPWKKTAVKPMMEDAKVIYWLMNNLERFPRHISKMCEGDCPYFRICMIELHGGRSDHIKMRDFTKGRGNYG